MAPFPLLTYADVQPRARAIAAAVESRRMPPWLPEGGEPEFVGARGLPDAHIVTIQRWAQAGALQGDPAKLPPTPTWSAAWTLGTPDLVATMERPYVLGSVGHDVYRNVVLQVPTSTDRFVRAIEFNTRDAPVHHAVIRVDSTRASRREDGADGQPGFEGMAALDVQDPSGHFLGWAPGRGPIVAPDDLPWRLPAGSDLVVELHLMPRDTAVPVQPAVGLYFTERRPSRTPVLIVMGSKAIDIPPGAREYTVSDRYQLPVDADVLSVYPHAHYLGRHMLVRAVLPDGAQRRLLLIPRWSFNWQQDYRFVTPVRLPRGTTIEMTFAYDNSDRPENPHHPPRRVTWGPQSHDEMANLGIQLVTESAADGSRLAASFAQHAAQIDVAGAETLVKAHPDSAYHAAFLGTSYVRVGRAGDAIPHLERAMTLDPTSSSTANHLGGALLAVGRVADALAQFKRASALAPRDAHLHFNVAKVLAATGRAGEAEREYRRALAVDPALAEAHQHLGVLLFSTRRLNEAVGHLQRAAELAPASPSIHADLGGALAQSGRRDDARAHLQRALQLDPSNETARENLARLDRATAKP
jgi:Flp pilus assembly protein TadD